MNNIKAIKVELQIKRVTLNKDDSVSFSAQTPELTDEELGVFRTMSKVLVNALLEPQIGTSSVLEIKERIDDGKSPSQRLRALWFVVWKETKSDLEFRTFYDMKMELIMDYIKDKYLNSL